MPRKILRSLPQLSINQPRHVREDWGLSGDQATRYIREARDLVKSDLDDVERADLLAAKIQMLEQIASDAVAAGRENNAIGAIRLLNELVGLGRK